MDALNKPKAEKKAEPEVKVEPKKEEPKKVEEPKKEVTIDPAMSFKKTKADYSHRAW